MRNVVGAVLFATLLVPSAWFAWLNRGMPQLGNKRDDASYYITAKAIAEHRGYRILSLPGAPFETKYPPVLPALMAIAWKIDPQFPRNLSIAAAIQWAAVPPFLWLTLLWLKRVGFSRTVRWGVLAMLAVSPYTVLFGAGIYSEVLFTVILLASLLAIERSRVEGWEWAACAGVLAGVAFLTRTAGVVALVSGPAAFLMWKKRREALAFTAGLLPFIAAWSFWVKLHQKHSTDMVAVYNLDYLEFERINVQLPDLGKVVWTNFHAFLRAIGTLAFPVELGSFVWSAVLIVVAVAAIVGVVRQWRRPEVLPYALFALLTTLELVVWHFPPNLRFMFPLIPLLAAGLVWEGENFVRTLRSSLAKPKMSDRAAAWVLGSAAAGFLAVSIGMQFYMTLHYLPGMSEENERVRAANVKSFLWIAEHADRDASVLSQNPSVYLYTGRQTAGLIDMPVYWYRQDSASMLAPYKKISRYAAERGLGYVYLHLSDFETLPDTEDNIMREVQSDVDLQKVFTADGGSVFEVRGTGRE